MALISVDVKKYNYLTYQARPIKKKLFNDRIWSILRCVYELI